MIRSLLVVGAALALYGAPVLAQMPATPPHDSATAAQKTPLAPKKPVDANAPAKDDTVKKPAARKPAPKKAPAKPTGDAKKTPPKKAAAKNPVVKPIKDMEPIHDEKGNKIPITPDAYDVSSALPGKTAPAKPAPKKK